MEGAVPAHAYDAAGAGIPVRSGHRAGRLVVCPRGRDFRFGGQTRRGSRGARIGLLTARERDDEGLTPAGSGALMGLPRWYSRLLVCVDRAIRTGRG